MSIQEHVNAVREKMAAAAKAAGRDPGEITLCAATKVQTDDTIREAIAAGITVCGENRVQELTAHLEANAYEGAQVHFIGHLQTNKVKQVVGKVDLIQSVDSVHLLEVIEREAERQGLTQEVLLEVNIGGEAGKGGFAKEEILPVVEKMASFSHIFVRGLMTVPPICQEVAESQEFFSEISTLSVDIRRKKYDNVSVDILSMGMSGDFETAIRCGSTMIRLGTAIFGPRDYTKSYQD